MDSFALLRAMASDERARNASDPAIRKEWEALAIEWHQLATAIVKTTKGDSVIHFQPFGSYNPS
jgi:hypothetical protein